LRNFWLLSIFQFCEIMEVITKMTVSRIQGRITDTHQTRRDVRALVAHDYFVCNAVLLDAGSQVKTKDVRGGRKRRVA
jgi:hypothetical protein